MTRVVVVLARQAIAAMGAPLVRTFGTSMTRSGHARPVRVIAQVPRGQSFAQPFSARGAGGSIGAPQRIPRRDSLDFLVAAATSAWIEGKIGLP